MNKFKPGASIRTHLLVAGAMWLLVGFFLMSLAIFQFQTDSPIIIGIALVLGTIKALFVLDKVAVKNIKRILRMKEGTCIGAVYSLQSWGLVLTMIIMGRLLRMTPVPREAIGALYIAVGSALLTSSRIAWLKWFKYRKI